MPLLVQELKALKQLHQQQLDQVVSEAQSNEAKVCKCEYLSHCSSFKLQSCSVSAPGADVDCM